MTLQLRAVTGGYAGTDVVRDVDLDVAAGEVLSVLGPSGSGKTTLLRMIAGLHPVTAGRVELGGREVTAVPAHRRRIGLVAQEGALFPRLSVAANIAYGMRGVPARRAAADPEVRRLLALVRLEDLAHRLPHELSGGQRQRVAVARALAPRPGLVLLDEPFSALDAALRADVREGVMAVLRDAGVASVLVTHDRGEALGAGDRVAVFDRGGLGQVGVPGEVYRAPASVRIAQLTGDLVRLPRREGAEMLVVRPEQLALDPRAELRGRVRTVRDEGARVVVGVDVAGGIVDVVLPGFSRAPRVGDETGVRIVGPALRDTA